MKYIPYLNGIPKPDSVFDFVVIYRAKYDINLTYNLAHQTDKILEEGGKSRIYNHL